MPLMVSPCITEALFAEDRFNEDRFAETGFAEDGFAEAKPLLPLSSVPLEAAFSIVSECGPLVSSGVTLIPVFCFKIPTYLITAARPSNVARISAFVDPFVQNLPFCVLYAAFLRSRNTWHAFFSFFLEYLQRSNKYIHYGINENHTLVQFQSLSSL